MPLNRPPPNPPYDADLIADRLREFFRRRQPQNQGAEEDRQATEGWPEDLLHEECCLAKIGNPEMLVWLKISDRELTLRGTPNNVQIAGAPVRYANRREAREQFARHLRNFLRQGYQLEADPPSRVAANIASQVLAQEQQSEQRRLGSNPILLGNAVARELPAPRAAQPLPPVLVQAPPPPPMAPAAPADIAQYTQPEKRKLL